MVQYQLFYNRLGSNRLTFLGLVWSANRRCQFLFLEVTELNTLVIVWIQCFLNQYDSCFFFFHIPDPPLNVWTLLCFVMKLTVPFIFLFYKCEIFKYTKLKQNDTLIIRVNSYRHCRKFDFKS